MHIKLMDVPISGSCDSQQTAKSGEFGSWRKGFLIVDTGDLCVALGNQTGFIAFNGSIRMVFDLVHPAAANGFVSRRKRDHLPSVVSF